MLIFQHSRRRLLERLVHKLDERLSQEGGESKTQSKDKGKQPETAREGSSEDLEQRKTEYLKHAVEMADKEIRKLEYWSDLVDLAHGGKGLGTAEAITEPPAPTKTT